jgi:hypothetical protein
MGPPAMRLACASALAATLVFAACTGKKSGDAATTLRSGTYVQSAYQSVKNNCAVNAVPSEVDGTPTLVIVTNVTIGVLSTPGTIDAGIIHASETRPYSWKPDFDCVESDTVTVDGQTTADDQADLVVSQSWVYTSGSQCAQAYQQYSSFRGQQVTLPCESIARLHVEKTGPLPAGP